MMTSLFVKITGYVGDFFLDFEHEFNTNGITVLYGSNGSGKSTITVSYTHLTLPTIYSV